MEVYDRPLLVLALIGILCRNLNFFFFMFLDCFNILILKIYLKKIKKYYFKSK